MAKLKEHYKFSDWIEHDGSGMPVSGDTLVLVELSSGYKETEEDFYNSSGLWDYEARYWNGEYDEVSKEPPNWSKEAEKQGQLIARYRIAS